MVHSDPSDPLHLQKMPSLAIVILAAGQGKRMKSALPKVLHEIAGKPMLERVIETALTLSPKKIAVVYGHGGAQVRANFADMSELKWALQEPQLGTGHAVLQALTDLLDADVTLVLYGDVPLITQATLKKLVDTADAGALAWLTNDVENPAGLGRIIRSNAGKVEAIVEEKDATAAQRRITEINTGFLACPTAWLAKWLPTLGNRNAQGEYYLTDILQLAVAEGRQVITQAPTHDWEVAGINSKDQLAALERTYQREYANRLMEIGVTLRDPARLDVRGSLECESDVTIDVNVVIEGDVWLGQGVKIGANCILRDCRVAAGTEIHPFSHIDTATIGANARIGPFARIRPGTTLAEDVHIGNFVEVKASEISAGSKANHLSYIGDASVGKNVNIGAGTITCNYDGANKHRTVIGDNVHIGSDVQLIAPVIVNAGVTIGAGSTIWKDVPADTLAINPKTQVSKTGWARPTKKPKG
jgi:bifunctional UDP-N-acetylglucosamine pyrophosphorylase/glucosamine-1-phosphate N-acetyltransferase